MNIFKKMVNELKDRIKLDVNMKSNGLCFNISLQDKSNEKHAFYLSVVGNENIIGGTLLCVLESTYGNKPLAPKFDNLGNMFVFLNGFLVPEKENDGKLLVDIIDKDGWREKLSFKTASVELEHGYILHYAYIPATEEKMLLDADGDWDKEEYMAYLCGVLDNILPADKTSVFVHDKKLSGNDAYEYLSFMISREWEFMDMDEFDDEKMGELSEYVSTYIYSNIMNSVEDEIGRILSRKFTDIPLDCDGQKKFVDHIKSSVKDKDKVKSMMDALVVENKH